MRHLFILIGDIAVVRPGKIKMKKYLLPFIFIFLSCNKKKNLHKNFRETIIGYQKKFPVPTNADESGPTRIFIYQAVFYKRDEDTLFALVRTYSDVDGDFYNGYEIYRDEELKPFVIIDIFNLSDHLVYKKKSKKSLSLWDAGAYYDEPCTPIYRYKVKNEKCYLVAKEPR